jgi:adenosylhomocysteine nucleosidase
MIADAREQPSLAPEPRASALPASPLGLVVAMEAELIHFLKQASMEREEESGPWRDRSVRVAGMPIVALCCGMGMVNAAAGTEHVIAAYRPRAILNYGCAGAHRRDILPGDVVIGKASVHHGALHILATGEEHFVGSSYDIGGEGMPARELPSDPALLAVAHEVAAAWSPAPWPATLNWPVAVPYRAATVHTGVVASADIWTQQHSRLDLLHERHRSLCEDMEAAAIAQVCARHRLPFLTIKDISNNEYHALTDIVGAFSDFPTAEVGKRAAALMVRVIKQLARAGANAPSI